MFINSVIVIVLANYSIFGDELDELMYTAKGMG